MCPPCANDHLARNVETQTQARRLRRAAVSLSPPEGVEERRPELSGNWVPSLWTSTTTNRPSIRRTHGDRRGRIAVSERVADQVREHLLETILVPGPRQRRSIAARMVRDGCAARSSSTTRSIASRKSIGCGLISSPPARRLRVRSRICSIMRDIRRELDLHAVEDADRRRDRVAPLAEDARAHVDRRERVSQIVTEDRQEALLKLLDASLLRERGLLRGERSPSSPRLRRRSVRSRVTFAKPISVALGVAQRGDGDVGPQARAVLADAPALLLEAPLARRRSRARARDLPAATSSGG